MSKIIKLKCQECGATMEVDPDKKIIFCPYCGSKSLIEESDNVKISQIENDTIKHVDDNELKKEKMQHIEIMALIAFVMINLIILLLL